MKVRKLRWRFYKKTDGPRGWGLRCKDYAAGCYCCEAYKFLDEHGRFPSFEELRPIAQEAGRIEHEAWLQTDEGKGWRAKVDAYQEKEKNGTIGKMGLQEET